MITPSKCPFPHAGTIVPETMPDRIRKLPMLRGFPVPWFVAKVDGEFDFRIADSTKYRAAVKQGLCWVCGEKLGRYKSFVIGPMCGVNRTNAEPPVHRECARYTAMHCPFLSRPKMKRREDETTAACAGNVAGFGIRRNPGACAVWTVKDFKLFSDGRGGVLFNIGEPLNVEWFAEGRAATRAEVTESIASGIHHLEEMCDQESTEARRKEAREELAAMRAKLEVYLPSEEVGV